MIAKKFIGVRSKRALKIAAKKIGILLISVSTLFYSFGGLDFYLGLTTPFAPKHADAAYTGKHLRTVEYILGNGTESVARATGVISYFGSGTSTTKAGAGTKSVVLAGTNIAVKNAYLDVSYIVTAAANVTNEAVSLDVAGSSSGGTSATTSQELSPTAYLNSGLSGYQRRMHDVTSFFDRQSDAAWSAGVGVVAGIAVTGPTRMLTTIRLVITYETDYSLVAHTETKTVRFPLMATSSRGTRGGVCVANGTCAFYATNTIPDAAADGDILDVYIEMHGEVDSATASTFRVGIRGGTGVNASSTTYNWTEATADDTVVNATWRPNVGSPNFQRNATQIIDVQMGTVPMNALGGELVVTYRFSTGAALQTDTVRYFLNQGATTTLPNVRTNFATITPTISNGTLSMKNIWMKAHTAATTTSNFTLTGKVGTTTEITNVVTLGAAAANPREGDDHTIVLDLSSQTGQFWTSTTTIAGATQFTGSGGAAVAVEVYFTFTWAGSLGGQQTQTVSFGAAQQGTNAVANQWNNTPVYVDLPETVTKTYRSAYIETKYMHSNTGTITTGSVTIGANGSTTAISETGDITTSTGEAYTVTYLTPIASTTFSNGDTIAWVEKVLTVRNTKNIANTGSFTNQVVVTYDVDFTQSEVVPPKKHLRTVEYILGNGTESVARATGVISYFGSGTSTTKAGAGTKSVVLAGTNIAVKNAYLDVSYIVTAAANVTNEAVSLDVAGSSSGGTSATTSQELSPTAYLNSGLSGYQRRMHDVTSFFDRQSDAAWSAGVGVVAGIAVTGPTRMLTTIRLVITYETDYSLVAHTETKTVRFPLMATSSRGTRGGVCVANGTCAFYATNTIPDAAADGDILDVYIEMHGEVDSATASTFRVGIRGGTGVNASSTTYNWTEATADDTVVNATWRPNVGSPNFQRNATQIIDVQMGTVPMNALGGELVVTYRFSTGAALQTDTVRYFLNQGATTTLPNVRTNFATITPTISNGTLSMKNIWMKAHTAATTTSNFTLTGKVGTTTEITNVVTLGAAAANPREGDDHTIVLDLSSQTGQFWTSTTTIAGATQFTGSGGAAVAVEVYFTFTWAGSLGGQQTQTVSFGAAQQGTNAVANQWNNTPVYVDLPETVTKTYRSAYIETKYMHSNTGTITTGSVTIGANGSTTAISETGDITTSTGEAYTVTYLTPIASTTFSDGDTIAWVEKVLTVRNTKNIANTGSFTNQVVVTYDANQEYKFPTFTQNTYRFFTDNDLLRPATTTAWQSGSGGTLGENTEITAADSPPGNGVNLRLRMSLTVATTTMQASSTQFKLQFAKRVSTCGAIGSWTDIGAPGSGVEWRGYNATPDDGSNVTTNPPATDDLVLSASSRAGLYSESNPTLLNPFSVAVGEDVEYDWNIQNNNAATDTPYCFRMTKSDGTVLNNYTSYPTAITAGYTAKTDAWRWYDDETNETPVSPLAGVNVAPVNVATGSVMKLRISVKETQGAGGVNQKFKVQYSEWADFSRGVYDLTSTTSCTLSSLWCYGNGVDTDNDAITSRVFSSTTANGTHNEGTSTTAFDPLASTATEFEFTIKQSNAHTNTTYFFRLWDLNHDRPVATSSSDGASYPSISTQGATVTFGITGVATSTVVAGETTDVATTPTSVPFYTIPIGSSGVKAAYRLTISTDANEGYQVFMKSTSDLTNQGGTAIPNVSGTNEVPTTWATACSGAWIGCYGYHTTDSTLSGVNPTRFLVDDRYAMFSSSTPDEVMYNSGPVINDTSDILFRVEGHTGLPGGGYTTSVEYIVVPIF